MMMAIYYYSHHHMINQTRLNLTAFAKAIIQAEQIISNRSPTAAVTAINCCPRGDLFLVAKTICR